MNQQTILKGMNVRLAFLKRLRLTKHLRLNIGKKSLSISHQGRFVTFGSNRFSLRTGIPGLTLQGSRQRNPVMWFLAMVIALLCIVIEKIRKKKAQPIP